MSNIVYSNNDMRDETTFPEEFYPSPTNSNSDVQSHSNHPSPIRQSHSPTMESKIIPDLPPKATQPNYLVNFINEEEKLQFHQIMADKDLNMPQLIFLIRIILRYGKENADLNLLKQTLQKYNSMDWKKYEHWDPECKYTRNLIDTDNVNFTLMLLCWNINKESPVHNHPQCECFVRCLQGTIGETRYAWPQEAECVDQPLHVLSDSVSNEGDVTLMNDDLGLHKITNVGNIGAVTLHLYFPPYKSCKLFLDCTGRASTSNVCFHTEFGHNV